MRATFRRSLVARNALPPSSAAPARGSVARRTEVWRCADRWFNVSRYLRRSRALVVSGAVTVALLFVAPSAAPAATYPVGFSERTVFSGLTNPAAVRFASDGRVFVAEKSGLVKVFDSLVGLPARRLRRPEDAGAQLLGPRSAGAGAGPGLPGLPVRVCALHPRRGDRRHGAALGHAWRDLRRLPDAAWGDGRRLRRERAPVAPHGVRQRDGRQRAGADRGLVPAVPEPFGRCRSTSAPTGRCTSPVATGRASISSTTARTAAR